MRQFIWSTSAALVILGAVLHLGETRTIDKRAAPLHPLDPHELNDLVDHSVTRDKRKVEVVTGVKNAVLGFVFNKLNSFIDQKTAWVDQLDHTNIAKNALHNIHPPADPITSLSAVISGAIGEKLQAAGPLLQIVTSKLGGGSGSSSGGHTGFNFGALLSKGLGGSTHGSASLSGSGAI